MNTIAENTKSVNWNEYQRRGQATRRRTIRPTKAQQAAFAKTMRRGGRELLTIEELGLLATMPTLTASQRAEFAMMAQSRTESALG